jgi:hypothetical protein
LDTRIEQTWDAAKRRAEKKGVPFDVTVDYLKSLFTGYCALSRIPFVLDQKIRGSKRGAAHPFTASIDRIDPKLGYVEGNVRWVLWILNRCKVEYTHEIMYQATLAMLLNSFEYVANQGYTIEPIDTYAIEIDRPLYNKIKSLQ